MHTQTVEAAVSAAWLRERGAPAATAKDYSAVVAPICYRRDNRKISLPFIRSSRSQNRREVQVQLDCALKALRTPRWQAAVGFSTRRAIWIAARLVL